MRCTKLAVLIRGVEGKVADGFAYSDLFAPSIPVVRVNDENLASDVKRTTGRRAWEQIIAIMQLRRAHSDKDNFRAQKALAKLHGLAPETFSSAIKYDESAQFSIAAEFWKRMRSVRLILWWNLRSDPLEAAAGLPERLEPGILCPDLKTALFVRAALGDLRACPCCDNPFLPERPDQQYCSITCRERFRKRRLRAKSKRGGKEDGALQKR